MLSERDEFVLEEKSQEALLDILKLVCRKNMNAAEVVHNLLNNKKSQSKTKIIKIINRVNEPDSEYPLVFLLIRQFLETCISDKDALEVAVKAAKKFIDELVSYEYMHPEELFVMTQELYDLALSYASYLNHLEMAKKLHDMIPNDYDTFYESFMILYKMYFQVDDQENIILAKDL
jgi:hypothetical protein